MVDGLIPADGLVYNHKSMVNIFCRAHQGFTVFHFNARSLNGPSLDYFRYIFENSTADVICISETWFKYELPDNMYALNGYKLFRNDRKGRRGGGVAIFVCDNLKAEVLTRSSDSIVEFISVQVYNATCRVNISCVYNPSRQNALDPFFNELSSVLTDFDLFIVCGDLNVDLLRFDNISSALTDHFATCGLTLINSTVPTRFCKDNVPSLLDVVLVSDLSIVIKFDQTSFISDHDLTFCSFDIQLASNKCPNKITFRDYNNINQNSLAYDLACVRWNDVWALSSVDEKLNYFMDCISNIFERHVPLKTVTIKSDSAPWFTISVLHAIREKNKAHTRWRKCSSNSNWLSYIKTRNWANSMVKCAKKRYYASQLNSSLSTKQLWKNLRKLNIVSNKYDKCTLSPELLNKHFVNTVTTICNTGNSELASCSVEKPFQFVSVNEDEVAVIIHSISSNAVGADGLPIRFIKLILPYVISTITHIINHCLTTSKFPSIWKIATITPIPKKRNASVLSDFRPISILPALAKVCERVMAKQITAYLDEYELLSPCQSGFRNAHSCTTAMLKILDDIRQPFDSKNMTLLCLLDFSKAFDSVNHDLLLRKLSLFFHFDLASTALLRDYLCNRSQKVKIGEEVSGLSVIKVGVPQGSILGPILFSMFVNDLLTVCKNASVHAYADDVQLYISGSFGNIVNTVSLLNNDLDSINLWARENFLMLNTSKSKVLPIYVSRFATSNIPGIMLGNDFLEIVTVAKNLGYYINSSMTCSDHVKFIIGKVYGILRVLRCSAEFTPVNVRRNLVMQLIMPYFTYFCVVFSKPDSVSLTKIKILFNNVTRYVYSLKKFDHISGYSSNVLGVDIHDYFNIRNLIFMHGLINSGTPKYLADKLQRGLSARSGHLVIPRYHYLNTSRFFFIHAVRLWNSLPITIRSITAVAAFKTNVYNFFANNV